MVLSPEHPCAGESGGYKEYVYEHILVAEEFLGRKLEKTRCATILTGTDQTTEKKM